MESEPEDSPIKVGTVGRIASGEEQGRFVKIEEMPGKIVSYLILTAADSDFQEDGGDAFVEDFSSLEKFFEESNWVIEWRETGDP